MESAGRLIQKKQRASRSCQLRRLSIFRGGVSVSQWNAGQHGSNPQPLRFAAGNGAQRLPESQVTESGLTDGIESLLDAVMPIEECEGFIGGHVENVRD